MTASDTTDVHDVSCHRTFLAVYFFADDIKSKKLKQKIAIFITNNSYIIMNLLHAGIL